MCFAGLRPAFLRASFTNDSFVSVSSVVPDLETRMKSEWARSIDLRTAAASSGSTFEMNLASSLNLPFAFAQFSSARYMARGPRSLPPIPIWTTVVNFSPLAFAILPSCTFSANSAILFCSFL